MARSRPRRRASEEDDDEQAEVVVLVVMMMMATTTTTTTTTTTREPSSNDAAKKEENETELDPKQSKDKMRKFIHAPKGTTVRVVVSDGRTFQGVLGCVDKQLNVVLLNATEKKTDAANGGEENARIINMALIAREHRVKMERLVENDDDDVEEEAKEKEKKKKKKKKKKKSLLESAFESVRIA